MSNKNEQAKFKIGDILCHKATERDKNSIRLVVIQVGVFVDGDEHESIVYQLSGLNQNGDGFVRGILDECEVELY
jgi:hypothetical protein